MVIGVVVMVMEVIGAMVVIDVMVVVLIFGFYLCGNLSR